MLYTTDPGAFVTENYDALLHIFGWLTQHKPWHREDLRDIVQSFYVNLVRFKDLEHYDPHKGRSWDSWIIYCCQCHLARTHKYRQYIGKNSEEYSEINHSPDNGTMLDAKIDYDSWKSKIVPTLPEAQQKLAEAYDTCGYIQPGEVLSYEPDQCRRHWKSLVESYAGFTGMQLPDKLSMERFLPAHIGRNKVAYRPKKPCIRKKPWTPANVYRSP